MLPLIGITGRTLNFGAIEGVDVRFAAERTGVYFSAFARSVTQAGGLPVYLPFDTDATALIERLDGLIVTGGQDVHPNRWGGRTPVDPTVDPRQDYAAHDTERDDYEEALILAATERETPILAVCRGIQLLNVVHGGSLIEDIDETSVCHDSPANPPDNGDASHRVTFSPNSQLSRIYGHTRQVNSWHHQCVDQLGDTLVATARAADGSVEAIELPGQSVVGVQWHPEWMSPLDPIFDWLIGAAYTPTNGHPAQDMEMMTSE